MSWGRHLGRPANYEIPHGLHEDVGAGEVTSEGRTSMSVHQRMETRMRIFAMQARLDRAVRDADAALIGSTMDEVRGVMDTHRPAWHEIQALRKQLSVPYAYPAGDASCLVCDEPIFGEHTPPEIGAYLYHYTRAWTLPKIRKNRSLLFRSLREMNDPQESLATNAFGMGLVGSPGDSLQITPEEEALFKARDWLGEINRARSDIKVGAFSMDALPDFADVEPDDAEYTVPRRLAASRGYAHPRMWAQYGDLGRGVCLILDHGLLQQAVEASTVGRAAWGYGDVSYRPIQREQSLGFYNIPDLLRSGVSSTLLENFGESLLTKHADWAHEAEYRFFVMDGSQAPWLVPITEGVFVGLVLGASFDSRYFRNVRAFAKTFGISHRVRVLRWWSGRAELVRI